MKKETKRIKERVKRNNLRVKRKRTRRIKRLEMRNDIIIKPLFNFHFLVILHI